MKVSYFNVDRSVLQARIASALRAHYDKGLEDDTSLGDTSLCAHCTDKWADNVAAVVMIELGRALKT